jgi:AAA family ATP:ADP antiporter
LLLSHGNLAAAPPYQAAILGVVVVAWLRAARSLSGQFEEAMAKEQGASSASSTAPA